MTEKPTIAKTKQDKSNIVTNSIKTLKMVHIKKKKKNLRKNPQWNNFFKARKEKSCQPGILYSAKIPLKTEG